MKQNQEGFTLIELVVVIVLLGILAAAAIPKYLDLSDKAKEAADKGYLGGLRSATVLIYASNVLYDTTVVHGGLTNNWPTEATVSNQMTESYAWQYWTAAAPAYNPTNGVWTAGTP